MTSTQQPPTQDDVLAVGCTACDACGRVTWPAQSFGCEHCGAAGEYLSTAAVPAHGTVHSFAEVHRHPTEAVPFTVVEVLLDAGFLYRGLADANSPPPRIGATATATSHSSSGRLIFTTATSDDRRTA